MGYGLEQKVKYICNSGGYKKEELPKNKNEIYICIKGYKINAGVFKCKGNGLKKTVEPTGNKVGFNSHQRKCCINTATIMND